MTAFDRQLVDDVDWQEAIKQAFFTPCPTCPALSGGKCPGCADHQREEYRLKQVRDSVGSAGDPNSGASL